MVKFDAHFDRVIFSKFQENEEVLATWSGDSQMYPAKIKTIIKKNNKFHYIVKFADDGKKELVKETNILTEVEYNQLSNLIVSEKLTPKRKNYDNQHEGNASKRGK
jgi:hypothetical protein